MKCWPFILLFSFPFFLIAQKTTLDINTTIGLSHRIMTSSESLLTLLRGEETAKFSYGGGLGISFSIGTKFAIKTGLAYQKLGYNEGPESTLMWPNQHNGQGGFDPDLPAREPAFPTTIYTSGNLHFIGIPITLRHYFLEKNKFNFFIEAGPAINFFLNEDELDVYKKMHLFINTMMGLDYKFSENSLLYIGSAFRYDITDFHKSSYLKEKQIAIGLNLGLRFSLKN